ncbi:hypothetical protein MLD38_008704 [Melastoma candidum]|uniref:Uncharacterized protein n=1 Tax=Melastoma candidum TaxID=119954 RepID=A0ACB9RYW9_9MYRT|nr:hypothetical protein MLD38_008704 [Melastoma candidum]
MALCPTTTATAANRRRDPLPSATSEAIITYPLQTVATRQQTERDPRKERRKIGTLEQIFQLVQKEGWQRLYVGLLPSLVGTAASQGVYYYFYQIFRKKAELSAVEQRRKGIGNGTVGMLASLWVAALSGCINVLITTPIWVVVTRMQTHIKPPKNSKSDPSLPDDLEDTTVGATEPPPYGMSNAIQEVYGEFWSQWILGRFITYFDHGLLSWSTGQTGATVVTYPLLVLKSRLQAKQAGVGDSRHHYKGMSDAILKIVRYEGYPLLQRHERDAFPERACSGRTVRNEGGTRSCSQALRRPEI